MTVKYQGEDIMDYLHRIIEEKTDNRLGALEERMSIAEDYLARHRHGWAPKLPDDADNPPKDYKKMWEELKHRVRGSTAVLDIYMSKDPENKDQIARSKCYENILKVMRELEGKGCQ